MRKPVILALAVIVVAVAAASLWLARRPVVVERPGGAGPPGSLGFPGGPPRIKDFVGRKAPDFEGVDLQGRAVSSAALRGRVVVLNVWATWCGPCQLELPRLEREVWQRFQPNVAVVAAARAEDAAKIRAYNEHAKLTFSLVEDPDTDISRAYGDGPVPRTYVIDRKGTVVYQVLGYGELEFPKLVAAVEKAIAQ